MEMAVCVNERNQILGECKEARVNRTQRHQFGPKLDLAQPFYFTQVAHVTESNKTPANAATSHTEKQGNQRHK